MNWGGYNLDAGHFDLPRFCVARGCKFCLLDQPCGNVSSSREQAKPTGKPGGARHEPQRESVGVVVVDGDRGAWAVVDQVMHEATGFHSCGVFSSASEASRVVQDARVRVVLVEISLPGVCGLRFARETLVLRPDVKIVMMTSLPDPFFQRRALAIGVRDWLVKPFHVGQCLATLIFVSARSGRAVEGCENGCGGCALDPRADGRLRCLLNEREQQLLACFAEGLLYKEAEERLRLSHWVLRKVQHRLYEKLHVTNRVEALKRWEELKSLAG